MRLLGDTTRVSDNGVDIEIAEPRETTSGMVHDVVQADRLACFAIGTQPQYAFLFLWHRWGTLFQPLDFFWRLFNSPPQASITHVDIDVETHLISTVSARELTGLAFRLTSSSMNRYRAPHDASRKPNVQDDFH